MGGDRWFSITFWVCCALLAVPLWTVEYLPMTDLPQHAAQIAIWTRWSDPDFGYQQIYLQNWFTPYLFGYLFAFVLTPFMSVNAALTTVITVALIGIPLAILVRPSGKSVGIGVAFVLIVLYYCGMTYGALLTRNGLAIGPFLMFLPNVLLTILGVVMLHRSVHR